MAREEPRRIAVAAARVLVVVSGRERSGGSLNHGRTAIGSGSQGGVKMNTKDKEELAQPIIELIETNDEVAWSVQSCACRSPHIAKVI